MKVTVSIPAKIMLSGEYAVLKGSPALATTLPLFLDLTLTKTDSAQPGVLVQSDLWATPKLFDFAEIATGSSKDVLADAMAKTLARYPAWQNESIELNIRSDFPPSYGFGSSSAIRLGLNLAFEAFQRKTKWLPGPAYLQAAQEAYADQVAFQGQASGYDIFTQATGGLCRFQRRPEATWPGTSECLSRDVFPESLWAYVGGAGADTKTTLQSTSAWLSETKKWDELVAWQDQLTKSYLHEPKKNLVTAMRDVRLFFQQGPNALPNLETELARISGADTTWSWKATGAGGEDALLCYAPHHTLPPPDTYLKQAGWRAIPLVRSNPPPTIRDLLC